MMRLKHIVLTLTCLLSISTGYAQNYWFKHISLTDGLSSSQINCICKDNRGFMWFGTSAGLDRYDGASIRQFQSSSESSSSLPDSYISSVQEAADGMLWIKTNGGYVVMDPVMMTFDQSISQRLSMIAANLDPEIIFFDKRKNLWVYDKDNALYYYKHMQQLVFTINQGDDKSGLPEGEITGICDSKDGVVVVYSNGRVACINGEQQKVLWVNDVIAKNSRQEDDYKVFCDGYENLCVYGDAQCYFYNKSQGLWYTSLNQLMSAWNGIDQGISNELITCATSDKQGNIWLSTDRCGLICLNPQEQKVVAHIKSGGDRSLVSNSIETVYVDDSNLLWVGTSRSGVAFYAPNLYMFDVDHVGDVYGISDDIKGGLWFATNGNGLIYKSYTGDVSTYTTANGLNDNMLSCVICGHDGTVWAGSHRFGINRISGNSITGLKYSSNNSNGLLDNNIQALAEDKFGNIWIGTRKGGLQCYNVHKGTFSNFNKQNNKLLSNNVTCLSSNQSDIVAGTTNGIMLLNLSSNKSTIFNGTKSGDKHFTSNVITQVYIDSRGLIWIGTRDGLNVLNTKFDQLVSFDTAIGLQSNVICGFAEDNNHEMWITTSKGVCRVSVLDSPNEAIRYSFNFYRYDLSDGLQGLEFNMGAICATNKGKIYLGGQNGINWIRNINLQARKRKLNVFLSRLMIDGQPIGVGVKYNDRIILPKLLTCMDKVHLRTTDNNICISLGVDDYNYSERPRYLYQLEGIKDIWLPVTGDGHTLKLNYLSRGTYTLRVKATLDGGKTISEEHTLIIVVEGPWYMQWWFILCVIVLILGLIYLIYRIVPQIYSLRKQRQIEINNLKKSQDDFNSIAKDLRGRVVTMIPQLGLLMLDTTNAEHKERLNGLQQSARDMLQSLNQIKESQKSELKDARSAIEAKDEPIAPQEFNGDNGAIGEELLVSDDGVVSANANQQGQKKEKQHVIFIVDSDAEMLEFVCDCLKSTYKIYSFTNTGECLNMIETIKPSVIICAENMPEITGSQFCDSIKNNRALERIPFVLTTDSVLSQTELVFKHITLMADDYIPSPYNLQSLISRINALLGEPHDPNVIVDDTLRGAVAMSNAVDTQIKSMVDQYIKENISRKDLNFEDMCKVMNVGRTLLFRKVEKVTGYTPTEYIRKVRLNEAAKLLESGYVTPAEVAEELGFGNISNFSRFFSAEYGVLPSQYAEGKRKVD